MKKKQGTRGAISVFLSIILVPCILISCLFVDASRVSLSRASAESSADLALNTLLTNYDADLKDWYGMVASCQNIQDFYEVSAKFFLRTLASQGMSDDEIVLLSDYYANATRDDTIYDLLKVETVEDVKVSAVDGANLSKTAVVKDQIVDFMKYRAPIEITKNIIERFKTTPGLSGVLEADENGPMVEAKKDYYEAHGDLLMKAIHSYWAINAYFLETKNEKFTNQSLQDIYKRIPGYREVYEKIMPYAVINLSNTSGLSRFSRYTCPLNVDGDNYTNPDKHFGEVYSKKEKDEEKEKNNEADPYNYLIDISKVGELVNDLSAKRDAFRSAVNAFGSAAKPMLDKLPYGQGADQSNPIQWWARTDAAVRDYKNAIGDNGREMIRAYAKVLAIDECQLKGSLPSGWSSLDQWKEKYAVQALKQDVENLQSRYLTAGQTDNSDNYLRAVKNLEAVSAANAGNISAGNLYIEARGQHQNIPTAISGVSDQIKKDRNQLDKYIKLLNKAIDGDTSDKTPSMDELRQWVKDYHKKLEDWKTETSKSSTDMKSSMETEIKELEQLKFTVEQVDTLKTRLVNIRSQFQDAVDALDSLKLGGTSIQDISDTQGYLSHAGVDHNSIGLTNSALQDYAKRLFSTQFKPDTLPEMKHADENVYNLTINPQNGQVETPEIFVTMNKEFSGKEKDKDGINKADDQKKNAKNTADNKAENAKNKKYTGGGEDIQRQYSPDGRAGDIKGLLTTLTQLVSGNFSSLRDGLYTTVYAMEMFSCATHENEGRYNLLASKDKEKVKELTLKDYKTTYESLNGDANTPETWRSASLLDSYNKSLTNKLICKDNNRAFAGEIEYILYGGTNADNIKAAYGEIYLIRYGLNLVSGFQNFWMPTGDNYTGHMINVAAGGIFSMSGGLIPTAVTKAVLIPILTIFETCNDMDRLEAGFPVEAYKLDYQKWWYALSKESLQVEHPDISTLMSALGDASIVTGRPNSGEGLFYSDYLTLFLTCSFMSGQNTVYGRLADLIQANMRKVTGSDGYSLQKSSVYFSLHTGLRVKPLMTAIPLFVNEVESDQLTVSTDWCTYQIDLIRGY